MNGHPDPRSCLVCGNTVPAAAELTICPEHMVTFQVAARMQRSPDWIFHHREGPWLLFLPTGPRGASLHNGTNLARPVRPNGVPFMIGSGEGFTADWLAVNVDTAEARQLTLATEVDAWLDVLGFRPVPPAPEPITPAPEIGPETDPSTMSAEELAALFARVLPAIGPAEPPQFSKLVGEIQAPACGFAAKPFGLLVSGSRGGSGRKLSRLTFTNFPERDEDPNRTQEQINRARRKLSQEEWDSLPPGGRVEWTTVDENGHKIQHGQTYTRLSGRRVYTDPPAGDTSGPRKSLPVSTRAINLAWGYNLTYGQAPGGSRRRAAYHRPGSPELAWRLFQHLPEATRAGLGNDYALWLCKQAEDAAKDGLPDLFDEVVTVEAHLLHPTIAIAGTEFSGDLLHWPAPIPFGAFHLEAVVAGPVVAYLDGSAYGFTQEELSLLLRQLVPLNDRPDLIAEYDVQFAEAYRRRHV